MASKAECDCYATELSRRLEELINWAVTHWPNERYPLLPSDFSESRREISRILGPKLGDGEAANRTKAAKPNAQYRNVNPMPWP